MCGHIRSNKVRNEDIHNKVRAVSIADKMREARMRLFGLVKRRCTDKEVGEIGYTGYGDRQRDAKEILGKGDKIGYDPTSNYQRHDPR